MPDKKLRISHKLAGVIDRLIKTTKIKGIDLNAFKGIRTANFNIKPIIRSGVPYIIMDERSIDCSISPQLVEVIEDLNDNKITKISLSELTTDIKAENLHIVHSSEIININVNVKTEVEDFFKKFNLSSKLKYKTNIRKLDLKVFKPKILKIKQLNYPQILNNYYLIKKCTISKKSAMVMYLSEKEQKTYWRKAIIQTRRDPKGLELIGVYYKVPYYSIDNFKIDFNLKKLTYRLKENAIAKKLKVCDIIIFRDMVKKKGIIIEN